MITDRFFLVAKLAINVVLLKDLNLSDRIYECDCGLRMDRDLNASINLRKYGYFIYQQIA